MPVVPISTVVGARSSRWRCEVASYGERATGIEPAFSAWEADVLPLNYARERQGTLAGEVERASGRIARSMRENLAMAYLPQRDPTDVIGRRISAFLIDTLVVSGVGV